MIDFANIQKYRENNRIEAKRSLGGLPKSLWETYSAFANTLGGILLLGVEEHKDKSLHLVNLPDPEALVQEFFSMLSNPKKVNVNILSEQDVSIEEIDGNRIIVIDIPRAQRYSRPVYVDGDPFTGTYRRSGEGDYRCTREEVLAMMRDAAVQTQDMAVLNDSSLADLDYDTVHRYRMRMKERRPGQAWETLDDTAFLYQLGAAGKSTDDLLHPTAAGLLMFGRETAIIRQYPHYMLDYQEQSGDAGQLEEHITSSSADWSGNLYDFYFRVYEKLTQAIPDTTDQASIRSALCEALANCLIHADYQGSRGIVILKKNDAVVFSNPGTFRIDVREAKNGGISDPRNAALLRMFSLIGAGHGTGRGMPHIYDAWEQRGWDDPVVQELFAPDRTTLTLTFGEARTYKTMKTAMTHKEAIVDYLTDHVTGSNADFRRISGLSAARVIMILKELLQEEIIVAEGTRRNRVYKLKS